MAHVHIQHGEHDQTASAFILRTDTGEPHLLLHMHKKLGVLLQPGGHVELLENPWQAIRHEVAEETGYDLDQLRVLQPRVRPPLLTGASLHPMAVCQITHDFAGSSEHRHTDTAYAFIAQGEPANAPTDGESLEFRWVSLEELNSLPTTEIIENVRQIGRYVLTTCVNDWEEVAMGVYDA